MMAYFCIDCWNEIHHEKVNQKEYDISKELLLCEGCEEYKQVVLGPKVSLAERIFVFLVPSWHVRRFLDFIGRLIIFPYFIFMYYKRKKKYQQNKEKKHR